MYERPEADAREKVAAGGDKTFEGARYPHQARAAGLAKLGAVVFMFDMVGYADSRPIVHREGFTDAEAELRLQSTMGLQMWNAIRALDFLASLPDVDPSRLGVTGESGGGTQTFLLSALDDRPVAAFPAVMVGGAMQGGCVCENAPLLRIGTNNIEIAALFAPKPLGLSGANDWTKDIMTLGLPELKSIYRLYGADVDARVMARHFPYEHNFNQTAPRVDVRLVQHAPEARSHDGRGRHDRRDAVHARDAGGAVGLRRVASAAEGCRRCGDAEEDADERVRRADGGAGGEAGGLSRRGRIRAARDGAGAAARVGGGGAAAEYVQDASG